VRNDRCARSVLRRRQEGQRAPPLTRGATQGERMNIFLENKLETAIALNMLSEFAMVDVAIYTIL
jgi:hypothetical protein